MHQVSLETICPLKAFQLHYCPDNDAKSIVKHFIFLHKFSVISWYLYICRFCTSLYLIILHKKRTHILGISWPFFMETVALRPTEWKQRPNAIGQQVRTEIRQVNGVTNQTTKKSDWLPDRTWFLMDNHGEKQITTNKISCEDPLSWSN